MPTAHLWAEDPTTLPMAAYALSCLLLPIGWTVHVLDHPRYCPRNAPLITYGTAIPAETRPPHIHIAASPFFGTAFGSPASVPGGPLHWDGDLPILFTGPPSDQRHDAAGRIMTQIDLLAGTFFLLTRYEEAILHGQNAEGRMLPLHAVAGREGFIDWPVVDVMRERLFGWLQLLGFPVARLQPWDRPFALALTHDVSHLLPTGPLSRWRQRHRRAATPLRHLDSWLDTEATRHIQATYFLPLRTTRTTWPISRSFRRQATRIAHAGHEIAGLLPRHRTDRAPSTPLTEQHPHTGKPLRGVRQTGWCWDAASVPAALAVHGFDYDCSLGFPDRPSFRCGTTWPFPLFDLGTRQPTDVWEVPMLCAGTAWLQADISRIEQTLTRFGGLMALDWSDAQSDGDTGYDGLVGALQASGHTLGSVVHLLSGFLAVLPNDLL
ncbi:MAG: hypothetical protein H7338_19790 [Candidatus Sericytochromatia bacterium]|nr:hypothetical protein [Candidatus Sericytochromatia bacterium]